MSQSETSTPPQLTELALLFLKLGTIGFGGPAAHIATMEDEVVHRRKWVSRDDFLDLFGATNLIPGPNSTEMAIHIGYRVAGWPGLIIAGVCFIVPAFAITTTLASLYLRYGQIPDFRPVLMGIQAAVLAVIGTVGWRLARRSYRDRSMIIIGIGVAAASLAGVKPVLALFVGTIIGVVLRSVIRLDSNPWSGRGIAAVFIGSCIGITCVSGIAAANVQTSESLVVESSTVPVSIERMSIFFFKVGAILYGTGYVLIAYLEDELVGRYGWLSREQLLEAVAIGQMTPGPILSSAAFIGYVVVGKSQGSTSGIVGAASATLAIFLPSFLFVVAVSPFVDWLRARRLTSLFLDSVNAASIGLMFAVTLRLIGGTLVSWQPIVIAAAALLVQLKWNLAPVWLVAGGGLLGWLFFMI